MELLQNKLAEAGYHGGKIRISHVECREPAQQLKTAVLEKYPGADILVYEAREQVRTAGMVERNEKRRDGDETHCTVF